MMHDPSWGVHHEKRAVRHCRPADLGVVLVWVRRPVHDRKRRTGDRRLGRHADAVRRGDFTPLVVTPLTPDPIPVLGTDGQYHVAYELTVLNASPRDLTITKIETLADGPDGPVVRTVDAAEVIARSFLVADYTIPP